MGSARGLDSIVETIAAHSQAPWDNGRGHASSASQDAIRKVCEVCGRQGTRQYVQTATGWRCSAPVKCSERHRPHREPEQQPAVATESAVAMLREIEPPPTPAQTEVAQLADAIARSNITARCQDCTRTWTLTGRVLERSIGMHEQTHSHIVDVLEGADA